MRPVCLVALALCVHAISAFWWMAMGELGKARIDPIVVPGAAGGHTHLVWGGSAFSAWSTTTARMLKSSCTSAPVKQDLSNYWAPSAFWVWKNGSLVSLEARAVIFYDWKSSVTPIAFPNDFQLLSGDPNRRDFDPNNPDHTAISWQCIQADGSRTTTSGFPNQTCSASLMGRIVFRSCGRKDVANSADHLSHTAWPVAKNGSSSSIGGDCPNDFPDRFPTLVYQVFFDPKPFNDKWDQSANPSQPFALSNGDTTGYGWHADFAYAWQPGVLSNALQNCGTSGSATGKVEDCSQLWTVQQPSCSKPNDVDELVEGTIPYLPPCFAVPGAPTPTQCKPAKLKPTSAQCRRPGDALSTNASLPKRGLRTVKQLARRYGLIAPR